MLRLLHIENIAVIEQADILFERGFNVLTGETGAGKSIVIDAISAILGERAYRDMIRTGADRAVVRAMFDEVPKLEWFAENDVPYEAELVIRREILADGRNLCRVNGEAVSVGVLRKLGLKLINIHGQHDSATLFDEEYHLDYLDVFAQDEALLAAYGEAFGEVRALRAQIERLDLDEGEKLRRAETLKYQIEEISKARLRSGEDTELEARRKLAQNAEKLADALSDASACLDGTSESDGAAVLMAQAERALSRLSRIDDSFAPLHETVTDLMYQVRDCAEQVSARSSELSFSEAELDAIEQRLDTIHRLRRKYGVTCDDILAYRDKAQQELDEIELSDDALERLRKKLAVATERAKSAAADLRNARKAAAERLTQRVLRELADLDMKKVRFSCEFSETELSPKGADAVAFYLSANAGEALKPLSKVASGGELARIMLALKNVLAERDGVPTLIFDEVDTGVSGRAAQRVAEKLRQIAKCKQVLCVTHLPQLAALASTHFLIAKQEHDGRTFTSVTPLDFDGRRQELARIIGGAQISEATLAAAAQMLGGADETTSGERRETT